VTGYSGYLEVPEIRAVIDAISKVSKYPERDTLLAETLWQAGGRVSEVIILVPEHIGSTSIILTNLKQRKKVKGQKGRVADPKAIKEVEVSAELCKNLKEYCEKNNITKGMWIFPGNKGHGKHVDRFYVYRMITKASEKAFIFKYGKKNPATGGRYKGVWPHVFRHSVAMYLYESTQDMSLVQQQLGHANINTTTIYAAAKKPKIRRQIAKLNFGKEQDDQK
jgi:integrase/recombinase XerD